jgi:hypothetical protein
MGIGFFFLLRPSKYLYTQKGRCPFCLQDIFVCVGELELRGSTIPLFLLTPATFVGLEESTMQKNGITGELIGLSNITDPYLLLPHESNHSLHCSLAQTWCATNTPQYMYNGTSSGTPGHITDQYLTQQL